MSFLEIFSNLPVDFKTGEVIAPEPQLATSGFLHVYSDLPVIFEEIPLFSGEVPPKAIIHGLPWNNRASDFRHAGDRYMRYNPIPALWRPIEVLAYRNIMLGSGQKFPIFLGTHKFVCRDVVSVVNGQPIYGPEYPAATKDITSATDVVTFQIPVTGSPRIVLGYWVDPFEIRSEPEHFYFNPGGGKWPDLGYMVVRNSTWAINYYKEFPVYAFVPTEENFLEEDMELRQYPVWDVDWTKIVSDDGAVRAPEQKRLMANMYKSTPVAANDRDSYDLNFFTHNGMDIPNGDNRVGYFEADLGRVQDLLRPRDGRRGTGCIATATFVGVTRMFEDGSCGGIFCSSSRYGRWSHGPDKTVKTLVGLVHKEVPGNWNSASPRNTNGTLMVRLQSALKNSDWKGSVELIDQVWDAHNLTLVGDWRAIKEAYPRYYIPRLFWGHTFIEANLRVDENHEPFPSGERPHFGNINAYICASQSGANSVLKAEATNAGCVYHVIADGTDPNLDTPLEKPRVVQLFRPGADWRYPFTPVEYDGTLIITETYGHRIGQYRISDESFIKWIKRVPHPEGADIFEDWYYYTSKESALNRFCEVRRLNLQTNEDQSCLQFAADSKLKFQYLRVCKNTGPFPPHSFGFVNWRPAHEGFPIVYVPQKDSTGTIVKWVQVNYRHKDKYGVDGGLGGEYATDLGYGSAFGWGFNRMYCAGAFAAIHEFGWKNEGDMLLDKLKYDSGRLDYIRNGQQLIHGFNGWSRNKRFALPYGENENKDYFLHNSRI